MFDSSRHNEILRRLDTIDSGIAALNDVIEKLHEDNLLTVAEVHSLHARLSFNHRPPVKVEAVRAKR